MKWKYQMYLEDVCRGYGRFDRRFRKKTNKNIIRNEYIQQIEDKKYFENNFIKIMKTKFIDIIII